MAATGPVVGIDLGGTNTLACVLLPDGTVAGRSHRPTDAARGTAAVIDGLAEAAHAACREAGVTMDAIDTVGVAVCGAVDHAAGVVLATGALQWKDVPLAAELQNRLARPVVLENDVNAAAWGEYRLGAGRDSDGMIAAWVGTGIGSGIVLDARLFHGPRGTAGELGQMKADCTGGEPRILEAIASRTGMRTLVGERAGNHPGSTLLADCNHDLDAIGTKELASAFAAADPLAVEVIQFAGAVLGSALANAVTLLSIDTVVLGGGMTESLGDPWVELVRAGFERDVFPPQAAKWCRIVATRLHADAGLVGAAMIASDSVG
ncbi:MAG: ROK family protein [Planctomycetota bacterium]|nr:ROK family protein [Planctomycetota bacterium]